MADRLSERASEAPPVGVRRIGFGDCVISDRAKALVLEALDSNRLSAGPLTARFEQEIAAMHGCAYGLMSNSGTSALHIAVAALKERHGWRDGDEVIVPALTFVATSNIVLYNGLTPRFVDVEPDYFCIDPELIEAAITPRTRAIIPVHIAGQPADMGPVMDIAHRHGLRVVEDSAEAMAVSYRGRPVSSFGDIGCFSTFVAHLVATGVGGICTTDDLELLELMKSLMNHGRDAIYTRIDDDDDIERAIELDIPARRFSFVRLGHSFRATEMEAALGIAQLEELPARAARRAEVARLLLEGLADLEPDLQLSRTRPDSEHAFMFFPVVVREGSRDSLVEHLERHGIETRYLLPLINQPIYRDRFGDLDANYPVAARLNETAFCIGCQPEITDADADHIIATFHDYFVAAG